MTLTREELLTGLGAARKQAAKAWHVLDVTVAEDGATLTYRLDRDKLRKVRRRDGRYLLRTAALGHLQQNRGGPPPKDGLDARPAPSAKQHRPSAPSSADLRGSAPGISIG
jgi:hypothetical protein